MHVFKNVTFSSNRHICIARGLRGKSSLSCHIMCEISALLFLHGIVSLWCLVMIRCSFRAHETNRLKRTFKATIS